MKYQPSAVSVVCTVCSDQPATRYPTPIPERESHRLENQPATSTPSSSSATTTTAVPASQATTLTSRRLRDGSPNGSRR